MFYLVNGRQAPGFSSDSIAFDLDREWRCAIETLAPEIVRVRFTPPGGLREPRTWSIAPGDVDVPWEGRPRTDRTGFANPSPRVSNVDGGVTIATKAMQVDVQLQPFRLTWRMADGRAFASDRETQGYQASERVTTLRHWMTRENERHYYGLGDKTGPLNLQGRRLRTLQMDALGYNGQSSDPLYKHWPFYIGRDPASGIAYGIYYDTQSTCAFDFGAEYDNYHGFYSTCEIENGDLDYYVLLGPRIRDVVARFVSLTGRMAFGPRWSLGYANTAMGLTDAADGQNQLSKFIDRAIESQVPVSAFHYGSGYSSRGPRRYVFTWNSSKFPDPKTLNKKFHDAGMHIVANIKPCLLDDHPAYGSVNAQGGFVHDAATAMPCIGQFWDGYGAHVDFTHPDGVRWWQQGLESQVLQYGIDAGWNDNNEYEIWDDYGESHGFGDAIPIERSRSLQGLLMTRATYEQQARSKPDERVFTITRAGCPGLQRYAQSWTGDNTTSWHTIKWQIRMGLTMSLSGMFNTGHDIGGFAGAVPSPEMLVRWTQSCALIPRCIMNSWKADGTTNVPWLYPEMTPLIRDVLRLRYRLMPYLYTQYWRAHEFGEPILRPTFYEFDDDPNAYLDCDEFMVGNALLVAPVVEPGATTRALYLPRSAQEETEWIDFHSGARYAGGTCIVVSAPLDRLPIFVRAGAVIPVTGVDASNKLHDEPSRVLRVFASDTGVSLPSMLYEDDGISLAYRGGGSTVFEFKMQGRRLQIERSGGGYQLPYRSAVVETADGQGSDIEVVGDRSVDWRHG